MSLVLDTHAWIWWVSERRRLSRRAAAAIQAADVIGLSPVSHWEIAMKARSGRLQLDRDVRTWLRQASAAEKVDVVPLSSEVATTAGLLDPEEMHGDAADRLIAALALHLQVPLITKDRRLRSFNRLTTIW